VRAVDPGQAVYDLTPLRELVAAHLAGSRGLARLLGLFGGVALLLASVGVFGVAAHAVARRRHEIGIRTALGAARDRIVGMVVRQGLAPVALGLVLGLPASVLGAGLLRDLLFQVDPVDPLTYVAVPTVLLLVALAAVWIPARRATRVDPVDALRRE
jgi:ABC-type antimicrobial peptide transport system permease subunit